jgi:hypothetical protein
VRSDAKNLVRRALRSYTNGKVVNEHGWFYHFIDVHSGERWKDVEMPPSDSIWLLAGALTCRQYFHEDREIGDLATPLLQPLRFSVDDERRRQTTVAWMAARGVHQVPL